MKRLGMMVAVVLLLAACAAPYGGQGPGEVELRRGVIEQITPVSIASNHHTGIGAVLGGAVGLGLGSLIGNGTGRDVAMALGALGGGALGNEEQKRYDQPVAGVQIIVRLANGVLVAVTQPAAGFLSVGQAVYVEGSGEAARVVAR